MHTGLKVAVGALSVLGVLLVTRKAAAADDEPSPQPTPGPGPQPQPQPQPQPGPAPGPGTLVDGQILSTVGKHWILTDKTNNNGKAANYGWHFKGSSFGGSSFERSVSLPNVRVIQGIGTAHDRFHADYSQTCVLASQNCVYQGQPRLLSDLLQDPTVSMLLSAEGPLANTRQPGVPQLQPSNATPSPGNVSRAMVASLPNDVLSREAVMLSWVASGYAEYSWAQLDISPELTVWVFSDAMRFGGVRVCGSATFLQQAADLLSCSLLTARLADIVFEAASRVILPIPKPAGPEMSSTAYMLDESDKISKAAG